MRESARDAGVWWSRLQVHLYATLHGETV